MWGLVETGGEEVSGKGNHRPTPAASSQTKGGVTIVTSAPSTHIPVRSLEGTHHSQIFTNLGLSPQRSLIPGFPSSPIEEQVRI